ncbi:molybdopterin cofactor-binding domain-containing protein [Streptomyces caeruleatus]|uniref:Aldehyde oxidase/xanthine dehydrogenase second molybdopterin binding domain-containing protein n=1 Tax=Streptomyces caeruleatus TaxID=661399 RepID=A0A101U9I5_9ACTN|nr:molybdopterin cofactor-binding domain-containing protein [Streptomyces caeruleatus]KUO06525.1 hypothetical protein AQJ67_00765 [Streptomyces caeruleatus]
MLVLEVTPANKVVVRLPRVEVGQGVTTAVAMMIAEELDARLADVDIPLADARSEGNQFTGGSSSDRRRRPENPRVTKVVMAADVRTAVNPRGLQAQLMGTAVDGISTILRAGLHIDRGAVRESSFADFLPQTPSGGTPISLRSPASGTPRSTSRRTSCPPTAIPAAPGELGVPAAAGAVANAYARATGTKPRRFPLNF